MFETIAASSFGFWTVALVIVLLDSAVFLAPGEFIVHLGKTGNAEIRVPAAPFLLRNRELVFTLFSRYSRPFYVSSIVAPKSATNDVLERLREPTVVRRWLSVHGYVALSLLALIGPALTMLVGISNAILLGLLGLYVNAIAALMVVAVNRKLFGVGKDLVARLALELILCPALAATMNKRFAKREPLPNTWQLTDDVEGLRPRIQANLECFDTPLSVR